MTVRSKKPFLLPCLGALALVLSTGCATPLGLLYSNTESGVQATSSRAGTKIGESCASSYLLGLIAVGDRSIEAARRNGGITLITSVDQSVAGSPLFYARYCTIVRGR